LFHIFAADTDPIYRSWVTAAVLLQQPLLARTHRILDGTASRVRTGGMRLPDDVPAEAADALSDALARDAAAVRTLLDVYGEPTGPRPD
jgi:hypothetical protein